jgi:hypothetical protein
MASRLKAKQPAEIEPKKPKVLVFGKPNVGKTFVSLSFPKPYFIDAEGGATRSQYVNKLKESGGAYFGIEEGANSFKEIIEQIKALGTEKHDYKTIVIDSISHLQLLEVARESEKMMNDKRDMTKTFGAEKKPAITYQRQLVNWLDKIDMTVILICHQRDLWDGDKKIGVTFDAWDKLEHILDLALNIKKAGNTRTAYVTKTRIESFPDGEGFFWNYEEFAQRYGKEIIEGEVKQIILATPEQLEKMKQLLQSWKSPDDWEEKAFAKAKCDSWEEMESSKIEVFINFIENKLKGDKNVG